MLERKETGEEGRGGCGELHAPNYTKVSDIISEKKYKIKKLMWIFISIFVVLKPRVPHLTGTWQSSVPWPYHKHQT